MTAVGFVTCRTWPEISKSDAVAREALARRGVHVAARIWNDPEERFDGLDAIVLRSCWDYHHDLDAFLAWLGRLEAGSARVWNPPSLVRWNATKRYLLELAAAGIAVPDTVVLDEGGRDLADLMDARGWPRAVVKPLLSASAHDTTLVERDCADEIARALAAGAIRRPALVQPFVEEIRSRGEWSLVFVEGEPTHAVLKTPAPREFRVQPRHGGRSARAAPPHEVAAAARRALAAVPGEPLYARVDLVMADRGPLLMEVELIEPGLFFDHAPEAAERLAAAILGRLTG